MATQSEVNFDKSDKTKENNEDLEGAANSEDYLVKCIGAFGAWQAKVCILASLSRLLAMWNMITIVFLTYDTDFVCTSFNGSVPVNVTPSTCYDDCTEYDFVEGVFVMSFVSEFELICDKAWLANFTQTVLMFGFMFGASLFGWISDRYGRRTALLSAGLLDIVLMVASPFSPNYWVYNGLRFFVGVASGGVLVVSVVFVMEVIGPQHREMAGCCVAVPDGLSEMALVAFAYFSPTWRVYLLGLGAACSLVMVFVLLVPETPRWLISRGRLDDAKILMAEAAKCNNLNAATAEENINTVTMGTSSSEKEATRTYFDLFKSKKILLRTGPMTFIWMVCGMCYLGINQYVTFLGSDVYVAVTILGFIQIPACILAVWINKSFGRKYSMIGTLSMTGLAMVLLTFTPKNHWLSVLLGIAGMSACSTSFNVLYVYSAELFPTPLRNMGYGLGAAGAKIGGMVAPFVATLTPYWIPSLILALLPLAAAGICFLLPETKGLKLQDHVD